MKPTLGCDVDSTLWDTGALVREVVREITGDTLDSEVVSTWTQILDIYGEQATTEIFARVHSPERFHEREAYLGAPETLRHLQDERGVGIHCITCNYDPEEMASHLEPWLREHFGPGVGLTVTTGDKLGVLRELGAFGLVDDRPETLERVADAGMWAAAKIQPWNRALVAERSDVHGFTDWREVPNLLPVVL